MAQCHRRNFPQAASHPNQRHRMSDTAVKRPLMTWQSSAEAPSRTLELYGYLNERANKVLLHEVVQVLMRARQRRLWCAPPTIRNPAIPMKFATDPKIVGVPATIPVFVPDRRWIAVIWTKRRRFQAKAGTLVMVHKHVHAFVISRQTSIHVQFSNGASPCGRMYSSFAADLGLKL